MFETALFALLAAWMLSIVGFDAMVVKCIEEWTNKKVSVATYYVGAFLFGFFIVPLFH